MAKKKKRAKRWTEADARRELSRQERSGLSMSAYARKHGLSNQRLSWWRKRLRESASAPTAALVPALVTMSSAPVRVLAAGDVFVEG